MKPVGLALFKNIPAMGGIFNKASAEF